MADILKREKEFLRMNEELDKKTKSIIEKTENQQPHNTSKPASRKSSISTEQKTILKKPNNEIEETPIVNILSVNNNQKPPIKPRWLNKSNILPRQYRDALTTRKTSKDKKTLVDEKAVQIPENDSKGSIQNSFDIAEKETIERISKSPQKSSLKSITNILKKSNNKHIETLKNEKFSENNSASDEEGKHNDTIVSAVEDAVEAVAETMKQNEIEVTSIRCGSRASSDSLKSYRSGRESVASTLKSSIKSFSSTDSNTKKSLSSDGLIKFLKSKVTILQDELENSAHEIGKRVKELETSYEIQKKIETQRDQAISKNNSLTEQMEKLEEKCNSIEKKLKEREQEFTNKCREMESSKREIKVLNQTNTNLEKRLYRANEELENTKNSLTALKNCERELKDSARVEKESVEKQVKVLKKQRSDLLNAYKKQLYLIDNLRRQNNCLEQSKMIGFGEKEFTKVLEWNSKN